MPIHINDCLYSHAKDFGLTTASPGKLKQTLLEKPEVVKSLQTETMILEVNASIADKTLPLQSELTFHCDVETLNEIARSNRTDFSDENEKEVSNLVLRFLNTGIWKHRNIETSMVQ